jgi:hypothetical protein
MVFLDDNVPHGFPHGALEIFVSASYVMRYKGNWLLKESPCEE